MARPPVNQTTSQPDRIPLVGTLMYRNSSRNKDARFINCFQESLKNEVTESKKAYVIKRPGLSQGTQVKVGGGTARGFAYWHSHYYSVIGSGLYKDGTLIQTLNTSTGQCGLLEFDNAGVAYLFVCDGTDAWVVNAAGTVTQVNATISAWVGSTNYSAGDKVVPTVANGYYYTVTTDAGSASGSEPTWPTTIDSTVVDGGITWTCTGEYGGFPSPHIPTPQFIDGYMLLPAASSADIYNSDVDNIYGWGASNFCTAEMWPDNVVSIIRQNNQFLALGEYSSEFFYDAAVATGSPFARNEGTVLQMGCCAPYTTYQNERFCIFVGQSQSGGRAIWLIEGFQPKKISTEAIERVLDAEGSQIASSRGYGLRAKGHLLFVINLSSCSLVYDVEEKVWHEWSTNSGDSHIAFAYNYQADIGDGRSALLNNSDGYIYILDSSIYTDNGTSILGDIYTSKYDANNMNRKFMRNLNIVGDLGSTYTIRWSDDDYTTWTSYATLNTSRPFFTRCGTFRRRAFHVRHTANEDFRAEAIEFELDQGTH